jgi:hypothetical protein
VVGTITSGSSDKPGWCLLKESVAAQPWSVAASRTATRLRVAGEGTLGEIITA